MLEVSNLKCIRGNRLLFSNVGFQLAGGRLLYLRGPNGAGKTSLLRILCGLSPAEAGEILWNGIPTQVQGEIFHKALCYLGHHNALHEALTVRENLTFCAALAGLEPEALDLAAALAGVGLPGCQNRLVRHMSQGQKRRIALSRLLLNQARLWILDEPFVALDQDAISQLTGMLKGHLAAGGMVVLTSHQDVDLDAGSAQYLEIGL